ncbi:MAG TPA: hypothetical protein VNN75_08580, partial [Stellaceae bacterium]|nr:hypothetical protein [Stellaceae bacterium]
RRARIEAFYTDRRLAPGGEEQRDDAAQNGTDASCWRALCHVTASTSSPIRIQQRSCGSTVSAESMAKHRSALPRPTDWRRLVIRPMMQNSHLGGKDDPG